MAQQPRRTSGLRIGTIYGAPIVMSWTTLLLVLLLGYVVAGPNQTDFAQILLFGLSLAVILVVSVLLHELAHATVAKSFGKQVYEVVLNIAGGHTAFDPRGATPLSSALIALAGPITNLLLALGSLALLQVFDGGVVAVLVEWGMWANFLLAGFNALPGLPMDGGHALEAAVWKITGDRTKGTIAAGWCGRAVALLTAGYFVLWPLAQGNSPDLYDGVLAILIFGSLWPAASASIAAAKRNQRRKMVSVESLMVPLVALDYRESLATAQSAADASGAGAVGVLGVDGALAGYVPVERFAAVPTEALAGSNLTTAMSPLPRHQPLAPSDGTDELIDYLRNAQAPSGTVAVYDGGEAVGLVQLADVIAALK